MKPETLKLMLDKIVEVIPSSTDYTGKSKFKDQIRRDIKELVEEALVGMSKEVGMYGHNTHSYTAAQAYLIEFRRIV